MRLARMHPAGQLKLAQRNLAVHHRQLISLLGASLTQRAAKLDHYRRTLEALSYRAVLKRGFSVTRDAAGSILRQVSQVAAGQEIRSELAEGEIRSIVDGAVAQPARRPKKKMPPTGPTLFGAVGLP
jgi:exodeoxyribonuclease VII large subunit